MNIELEMNLKLSPDALKSIIIDYLRRNGYTTNADDMEFVVDVRYEGYGRNEQPVHYFKEVIATVKGEIK